MTLEAESKAISKSKTTCFHMRHKLYEAVSKLQDNVRLSGNIEFNPSYTKINLKGTKKEIMPRKVNQEETTKQAFMEKT